MYYVRAASKNCQQLVFVLVHEARALDWTVHERTDPIDINNVMCMMLTACQTRLSLDPLLYATDLSNPETICWC